MGLLIHCYGVLFMIHDSAVLQTQRQHMRIYRALQLRPLQMSQLAARWRRWCDNRANLSCKLATTMHALKQNESLKGMLCMHAIQYCTSLPTGQVHTSARARWPGPHGKRRAAGNVGAMRPQARVQAAAAWKAEMDGSLCGWAQRGAIQIWILTMRGVPVAISAQKVLVPQNVLQNVPQKLSRSRNAAQQLGAVLVRSLHERTLSIQSPLPLLRAVLLIPVLVLQMTSPAQTPVHVIARCCNGTRFKSTLLRLP